MKSGRYGVSVGFVLVGFMALVGCGSILAKEALKAPPGKVPNDFPSLHYIGIRWLIHASMGTDVATSSAQEHIKLLCP